MHADENNKSMHAAELEQEDADNVLRRSSKVRLSGALMLFD
jgi:hypothetical protein